MNHFARLISVMLISLLAQVNSFSQTFNIPFRTGVYPVGFKSYWKNDQSRIFNAPSLDTTIKSSDVLSRPVMLNIWYPSVGSNDAVRMEYGKYLQPVPDKTVSPKLVAAYQKYNRATAIYEITGKEENKLTDVDKKILATILTTKTTAGYKAKAVNKKFPLIIYHPGNGASLDDNIILCELLASHGYVVISSSYFNEQAATWGVDGGMGSVRDISFILSNISSWETNTDPGNAGIIGHSAGAQAAHVTMAQGSLAIKAMVSLETTQEYYTLADKRWKRFLNASLEGVDKVKGDLLFIANPGAIFQLADSMKNANRYYVTMPDVEHNDFISQGIVHKYMQKILDPSAKNEKEFNRVVADYVSVCNMILAFTDAKLKSKGSNWAAYHPGNKTCNTAHASCMEWMPAGKTAPEKYSFGNEAPGTRQFRELAADNVETAVTVLDKFYPDAKKYAFYDFTYAYAVIDELMENGRKPQAGTLYKAYKKLFGKPFIDDIKFKCEFFGMFNKKIAADCITKLEFLEKGE